MKSFLKSINWEIDMALENAEETIIQFTLISSVVSFAIQNVKGALENDGWYDEMMLAVGVAICMTFDVTLIEDISGNLSTLSVGPWIDYVIGGSAMAGGGAKLIKKINNVIGKLYHLLPFVCWASSNWIGFLVF